MLNIAQRMNIQGGPKKVSHHQFFKKIALKIANEIKFLRKVKV